MSKIKMIGLIILAGLLVTACGSKAVQVDEVDQVVESASEVAVDNTGDTTLDGESEFSAEQSREQLRADFAESALPPASQLVLGTLMLEDSEDSVDSELAAYLTPYWKLYRSMLESDTTAPEELDALIDEVQEVMNPDQVNYIADLELTQEDLMTYMNESGIVESLRPEDEEAGDGTRPNRPEGMPDGQGRGQGGGMEGMDPETQATMQAQREEMGGAGGFGVNRMLSPLIDALIELLVSKTG